ncbi:MAG: hypothetical protein LBO62_03160, partial [Endomicrobium sp.]|nr:hypothetical protein [Endomicrobium sp.]
KRGIGKRNEEIKKSADVLDAALQTKSYKTLLDAAAEQLEILFQTAISPAHIILYYLAPVSFFVDDKQTGKPFFERVLAVFKKETARLTEYAINGGAKTDNFKKEINNLHIAAGHLLEQAYPANSKEALRIISAMLDEGYIDAHTLNKYHFSEILDDYEDYKKFYGSLNNEPIDKDISAALSEAAKKLESVEISDAALKELFERTSLEISELSQTANLITLPAAEAAIRRVFTAAKQITDDDKARAEIVNALTEPLKVFIKRSKKPLDKQTINAANEVLQDLSFKDSSFESLKSLFLLAVSETDDEYAQEYLYKIISSAQKTDEILKILYELISVSLESRRRAVQFEIFKDFGANYQTLFFIIDALKHRPEIVEKFKNKPDYEGYVLSLPQPASYDDKSAEISYSSELVDLLVENIGLIDAAQALAWLFSSKSADGVKTANEVMDNLFYAAENKSYGIEKRKTAATAICNITARYYSLIAKTGYAIDIDRIKNIIASLEMSAFITVPNAYVISYEEDEKAYKNYDGGIFTMTPFITNLPQSILPDWRVGFKNPTFFYFSGNTDRKDPETSRVIAEFENIKNILKLNAMVLDKMASINAQSSKKEIDDLFNIVEDMCAGLESINSEHGKAAKSVLDKIRSSADFNSMGAGFIREQFALKAWDENEISKINNIHTLINAVHQTSMSDFKQNIGKIKDIKSDKIRSVKAVSGDSVIGGYDLSDSTYINKEISDLFVKLTGKNFSLNANDFLFSGDILVWTTRLFVHSVDMFFNFGGADRGISIYYNEGGRKERNALRVDYFTKALQSVGFSVTADISTDSSRSGTCGLRAVLNKDSGLNENTDLVHAAFMAIMLYKHSTNLDMQLEGLADRYSRSSYDDTLQRLLDKFAAGEIWHGYNYHSNGNTAFGIEDMSALLTERPAHPYVRTMSAYLNSILSYLNLEPIADVDGKHNIDQNDIDKYFNKPIERAYIDGKIILNAEGELAANKQYDVYEPFKSAILDGKIDLTSESNSKDETYMLTQARFLNLAGRANFNYTTSGFIGELMFESGFYRLPNGFLSVKALSNPLTGRIKYAVCELISNGKREQLDSMRLFDLLYAQGYEISVEGAWDRVGKRERKAFTDSLKTAILRIDGSEILSSATSAGNGTYVAGDITFDKNSVKENEILVVAYTTPDDVKAIETAKAVIATGGGILSHAAITTRELNKPSVVLNNAFLSADSLEAASYKHGEIITFANSGVNAMRVIETVSALSAGDRILLNGENGKILLFNDVDKNLLDKLQSYIDASDVDNFKKFISQNEEHKDIKRFVEYAYFQSMGDKRLNRIMFSMFGEDMPQVVKEKIKELNESYISEKAAVIAQGADNLKNIKDINIAYASAENLYNKLNSLQVSGQRKDIDDLKEEISAARAAIREKMLTYLNEKIKYAKDLLLKDSLSESDLNSAVKLLNLASAYNYFISQEEENENLVAASAELKILLSQIMQIISYFQTDGDDILENEISAFKDIYEKDVYKFGSKAGELAIISRALKGEKDALVSEGIGVSKNVFDAYFAMSGQGARYKELEAVFESAVMNSDEKTAKLTAQKIRDLIDELKDGVAQDKIMKVINSMLETSKKYSVRSSGVGEDAHNAAFAGMGETGLNVSYEKIYDNIIKCWKSFYSPRSVEYMFENSAVVKPAVLIQEMVDVNIAGVAFSRDKYGVNAAIEAVYGLGEGLVSGQLTPDSITVDNITGEIIEYSVANKQYMVVPSLLGDGTELRPTVSGSRARALRDDKVKILTKIIMRLEEDAGYPVDVEFALDKVGKVYVLQRRAITTFKTQGKLKQDKQLALISKETEGMPFLAFIPHPSFKDTSVPVYYASTENDAIVLCLDPEFQNLKDNAVFAQDLSDRIVSDEKVRRKLNFLNPVNKIVRDAAFTIDPLYRDNADNSVTIPQSRPTSVIKDLLSAA